ncbi:MAG TPA: hypothetical protein VGO11_05845 [Chthoniobacteraceae bacterium]|jgi:hypothetical protein|nr:hypothetical protein [Chthoniobacteraceae bacterium]
MEPFLKLFSREFSNTPSYFNTPELAVHPTAWVYGTGIFGTVCLVVTALLFWLRPRSLSPSKLALIASLPSVVGAALTLWQIELFLRPNSGYIGPWNTTEVCMWDTSFSAQIGVYCSFALVVLLAFPAWWLHRQRVRRG